jgi:hypothetical protein
MVTPTRGPPSRSGSTAPHKVSLKSALVLVFVTDWSLLLVAAGKVPLSPNTGAPMGRELIPNHTFRRIIEMIQKGQLAQMKRPAVEK